MVMSSILAIFLNPSVFLFSMTALGTGITITANKVSWDYQLIFGVFIGFIIFGVIILAYLLYRFFKKSRFEKELVMRAEIAGEYEERRRAGINEKRKRTIESRKSGKKPEASEPFPEYIPEKHLKEEEKQVVNILKQRESQAEQGTLRIVSGLPKSTLSRILKELEERNIIYKEKRGKKNMVFLR